MPAGMCGDFMAPHRAESRPSTKAMNPKAPSTSMAFTWALKGLLYACFGPYVSTR